MSVAAESLEPRGALRARLALVPAGGGTASMLRPFVGPLLASGVAVLLYDPPGHGGRFLPFTFEGARDELQASCRGLPPAPLFLAGHSMGVFTCLLLESLPFEHLFAVAPLLDSRRCVLSLYEEGRIGDLLAMFSLVPADEDALRRVLSSPDWLSESAWPTVGAKLAFPSRGRIAVPDVGAFLRELFVPGFRAWDRLAQVAERTSVFVAPADDWFPQEELHAAGRAAGVEPLIIPSAEGHAFGRGWTAVMARIGERILERTA
jgi:hypothetical protein